MPSISVLSDQAAGGAVVWIPPGFLSMVTVLLLAVAMRKRPERAGGELSASP